MLDARRTAHSVYINETVNIINAQTQAQLASMQQILLDLGTSPALVQQKTLALVAGLIHREASIMAFSDTMFLLGGGLALAGLFILPASIKNLSATKETAIIQPPPQVVIQN
jgi:hypothetical protein